MSLGTLDTSLVDIKGSLDAIFLDINGSLDAPGGIIFKDNPILVLFPPIADNTFQFYKFYQIKKNQVPSVQTDIPLVTIDNLPPGVIQEASGFDIRVFDSAGVALDYESVDVTINPDTSADIVIWVNVATVQDHEFIQLTFGKATATDGQNPNAVWTDYIQVNHLFNSPNDSTVNGNDLTVNNATPLDPQGYFLDGIDDDLDQSIAGTWQDTYSLQIDFELLTAGEEGTLFSRDVSASNFKDEMVRVLADGRLRWFADHTGTDYNLFSPSSLSLGKHSVVLNVTSDTKREWFLDGVNIGNFTGTNISSNANPDRNSYGVDPDGGGFNVKGDYLECNIFEIFNKNAIRSADLITTERNNQLDNTAFWFRTPILENGVDNLSVDDQGNVLVAEGQ